MPKRDTFYATDGTPLRLREKFGSDSRADFPYSSFYKLHQSQEDNATEQSDEDATTVQPSGGGRKKREAISEQETEVLVSEDRNFAFLNEFDIKQHVPYEWREKRETTFNDWDMFEAKLIPGKICKK